MSNVEQQIDISPRWLLDLNRSLAVRSQFAISGNIRDVFPVQGDEGVTFNPIIPTLWESLSRRGYDCLLIYDRIDGMRVYPPGRTSVASRLKGLNLAAGSTAEVSLEKLANHLREFIQSSDLAAAFVVDYASRLVGRPQELDPNELSFFRACEKFSHTVQPLRPISTDDAPPFNPIIWLLNNASDLPSWYVIGNETLRTLILGYPDRQQREFVASLLTSRFPNSGCLSDFERRKYAGQFALLTEGLTLRSLMAIAELSRDQKISLEHVGDAVRCYKVGVSDNPWGQAYLRQSIADGSDQISERVKGQSKAIQKSLDILMRSVMGLSGAHTSSVGGRPRGVLFFAGPTGVGKTELAKSITELLFGDEQAYHRFDMSEFSAEHSEARLIGAPPGYIGHDAGGELVNAVRQSPFCVLLFDEIEKAHPRILDKFLQILEDGRLTDGTGDTVFFSEAIIIFTSNLGIYTENTQGIRELNVSPEDPYEEVSEKVKEEIEYYFRFVLQRPELLNRIGDNIVIFDFIRRIVAEEIFLKMTNNVLKRVNEQHGINLSVSEEAYGQLMGLCLSDLSHGGRGIGNLLESYFINPLSRALFYQNYSEGSVVEISGFIDRKDAIELLFR